MANKEDKILEVKDLRISFKTNGGTVKAVRGINFSLYRGRVLAIVGESGSGKSVTSKAILGILANNKIIEDGEIIFEGKDLLKLSEEDFTKIRGVKISMIYQDPLSSLNPIMKVGKQLTEAMVLKTKATRRNAKKLLSKLDKALKGYLGEEKFAALNTHCKECLEKHEDFDLEAYKEDFIAAVRASAADRGVELEKALNIAKEYQAKFFAENEAVNLAQAKKEARPLLAQLKRCLLSLAVDSDDTIQVFPLQMLDRYHEYRLSSKSLEKQAKLFEKYQVQDIYSLPPAVRAKIREVIVSPEDRLMEMRKVLSGLIAHIETLLALSQEDIDNQALKIEKAYFEAVEEAHTTLSNAEAKEKAIKLLSEVGIPDPEKRYYQYPFEFSGGMRQRIVIAIALSSNPEVLICDEPTTALDVTIQAQILELINKLKVEKNLSIIFITHDLGVVANMADDIAVMYAGKIVEYGTVYDIFYDPRHPYTWALLGSMPDLKTKERLNAIPGTPPNMLLPPKGDAFAMRNRYATEMDYQAQPPFFEVSPTHYAATWLLHPQAPDVQAPSIVVRRISESLASNNAHKPEPETYKNSVLNYIGGK